MPHGDILYRQIRQFCRTLCPYECSDMLREKIRKEMKWLSKAMGLNNCAVNIDFIEENGVIYVLELTGRIGANCLP